MTDKKTPSGLILPNQGGISNLEIRRIQKELDGKPRKKIMHGHMPADIAEIVIRDLKNVIKAVERGEVSSICVVAIQPKSSNLDEGFSSISVDDKDLEKLHELFHIVFNNRTQLQPPPPKDSA